VESPLLSSQTEAKDSRLYTIKDRSQNMGPKPCPCQGGLYQVYPQRYSLQGFQLPPANSPRRYQQAKKASKGPIKGPEQEPPYYS